MQQQQRRNRVLIGVLSLGLLAGAALTGSPAQAVDATGPYYAMPSWDRKMASDNRFVVLTDWNSEAVLDKETGLVWERTPSSLILSWLSTVTHCLSHRTGNHSGWRLPSVHDLMSLVDPSVSPGPSLPPGYPFTNVQAAEYWSASTFAAVPTNAWDVTFEAGAAALFADKDEKFRAWCVRGGNNAETY